MIKLKEVLNEGSSWLSSKVVKALDKELKRIEPQMYANKYFKKAWLDYLLNIGKMKYSDLGQKRFKNLDKAWDYIDKNTEALSSTNDKLNRVHIRTQLDGPVYAMLKHNRYNLK